MNVLSLENIKNKPVLIAVLAAALLAVIIFFFINQKSTNTDIRYSLANNDYAVNIAETRVVSSKNALDGHL